MKEEPRPPKLILNFFRWFCNPAFLDYIEGDLHEAYERRLQISGKRKADILFFFDVLTLFRPGIIKLGKSDYLNNGMFRNNLKIAIRSLWKNKASTAINVFGLTTGITSCILIALFISYELSFDQFQTKKEQIVRVIMEYSFDDQNNGRAAQKGNFTSTKVAPVFSRTFPEVVRGVRMTDATAIVQLNNEPVTEENFVYADSSFFDVFDNEFIEGNPATALNGVDKVVLTESTAKKYFGNERATGQVIMVGGDPKPYEVTGVIRDYPSNSQLQFDFLASFSSLRANQQKSYFNANYTTYLLLTKPEAIATLQEKLHPFMEKEMKGTGASIRFYLEPFQDIHVLSPYTAFRPNTSATYLYILGGVALLIIVIVCFTYINLSTARSIERAKEVGIRKVSGAIRHQLFWQFIGESFILFTISVMVSIAIAALMLPFFNSLMGKTLEFSQLLNAPFLLSILAATIIVSLMSGGYPAIVLSGLQPAKILKGLFKNSPSARFLQASLTVFQFAISVFLIVTTIVIQSQLHFIQNQKLGYDRDHVLSVAVGWNTSHTTAQTIKSELDKTSSVISAARCVSSPVNISSGYSMRLSSMPESVSIITNANPVDEDYVRTTGLELIAGTGFTSEQVELTNNKDYEKMQFHYIINESAAKKLGFENPADAVGVKMVLNSEGIITGVVRDFHFQSMRKSIEPLVLFTSSWGNRMLIKVQGDNLSGTISSIEGVWKKLLPHRPFEFRFLDEEYNNLYKTETQLGKMLNVFASIAIILACLGLFGLSSFMIQRRMKEISIRKILGASLPHLLHKLSVNFLILVMVAIAIASPLAYYIMDQWLSGFVYRIDFQFWMFGAAALATILIAVSTVSIRGLRAATENPVNNLKSE